MAQSLHPMIDNGLTKGQSDFSGGTLHCHCKSDPVEVEIKGNVLHNHACGCSQCWKPKGALFSIVAVTPDENVKVTKNKDKLTVQNKDATILRNECQECGVHMFGPIEKDHAFKGLSFVHVELSDQKGWQEPQFAAFVSSLADSGYPKDKLDEVRQRLRDIGLEPYDALSPELMDLLKAHADKKGKL